MRLITVCIYALVVGSSLRCALAGDVDVIIAPTSVVLTPEGSVDFTAYLFNRGKTKAEIPAPQGGFKVAWKLHDVCNARADRSGNDTIIGTHSIDPYMLKAGTGVRCEHLGVEILCEVGDVAEFYIVIERAVKSGAVVTLRSNSIVMYRPR